MFSQKSVNGMKNAMRKNHQKFDYLNIEDKGPSPLIIACQKNDLETVRTLLRNKTDVGVKDQNGRTALFYACIPGNLEIVKALHQSGADLSIADQKGETPMHVAAKSSCIPIIKYLLANGCAVSPVDNSGNTPLHIACWFNQLKTAQILHRAGASLLDTNKDKDTPLHNAVRWNHLEVAQWIASIPEGKSTLMAKNNVHAIKTETRDGDSPIDIAKTKNFPDDWYLVERVYMGKKSRILSADAAVMGSSATLRLDATTHLADFARKAGIAGKSFKSLAKQEMHHDHKHASTQPNLLPMNSATAVAPSGIEYADVQIQKAGSVDPFQPLSPRTSAPPSSAAQSSASIEPTSPGFRSLDDVRFSSRSSTPSSSTLPKKASTRSEDSFSRVDSSDSLKEEDADMTHINKNALRRAVITAVKEKNMETFTLGINLLGDDVNFRDKESKVSLMHVCCETGYCEAALKLLNKQADWWTIDKVGRTPVHLARQNFGMMQPFLDKLTDEMQKIKERLRIYQTELSHPVRMCRVGRSVPRRLRKSDPTIGLSHAFSFYGNGVPKAKDGLKSPPQAAKNNVSSRDLDERLDFLYDQEKEKNDSTNSLKENTNHSMMYDTCLMQRLQILEITGVQLVRKSKLREKERIILSNFVNDNTGKPLVMKEQFDALQNILLDEDSRTEILFNSYQSIEQTYNFHIQQFCKECLERVNSMQTPNLTTDATQLLEEIEHSAHDTRSAISAGREKLLGIRTEFKTLAADALSKYGHHIFHRFLGLALEKLLCIFKALADGALARFQRGKNIESIVGGLSLLGLPVSIIALCYQRRLKLEQNQNTRDFSLTAVFQERKIRALAHRIGSLHEQKYAKVTETAVSLAQLILQDCPTEFTTLKFCQVQALASVKAESFILNLLYHTSALNDVRATLHKTTPASALSPLKIPQYDSEGSLTPVVRKSFVIEAENAAKSMLAVVEQLESKKPATQTDLSLIAEMIKLLVRARNRVRRTLHHTKEDALFFEETICIIEDTGKKMAFTEKFDSFMLWLISMIVTRLDSLVEMSYFVNILVTKK